MVLLTSWWTTSPRRETKDVAIVILLTTVGNRRKKRWNATITITITTTTTTTTTNKQKLKQSNFNGIIIKSIDVKDFCDSFQPTQSKEFTEVAFQNSEKPMILLLYQPESTMFYWLLSIHFTLQHLNLNMDGTTVCTWWTKEHSTILATTLTMEQEQNRTNAVKQAELWMWIWDLEWQQKVAVVIWQK